MAHIDIKVTIWNRIYLNDKSKLGAIENLINNGVDGLHCEQLESVEWDSLLDTEEILTPEENNHQSTIEVYDEGNVIWENGK